MQEAGFISVQKPVKFFFCFVAVVRVKVYHVDFFVFFVFYVTGECYKFLHRGWAKNLLETKKAAQIQEVAKTLLSNLWKALLEDLLGSY